MAKTPTLDEMADSLAKKFGITPYEIIYDSVAFFYGKVRKEMKDDTDTNL